MGCVCVCVRVCIFQCTLVILLQFVDFPCIYISCGQTDWFASEIKYWCIRFNLFDYQLLYLQSKQLQTVANVKAPFPCALSSEAVETCSEVCGSSLAFFPLSMSPCPVLFLRILYELITELAACPSPTPGLQLQLDIISPKLTVPGILVISCCMLVICECPWGLQEPYVRSLYRPQYSMSGAEQAVDV